MLLHVLPPEVDFLALDESASAHRQAALLLAQRVREEVLALRAAVGGVEGRRHQQEGEHELGLLTGANRYF